VWRAQPRGGEAQHTPASGPSTGRAIKPRGRHGGGKIQKGGGKGRGGGERGGKKGVVYIRQKKKKKTGGGGWGGGSGEQKKNGGVGVGGGGASTPRDRPAPPFHLLWLGGEGLGAGFFWLLFFGLGQKGGGDFKGGGWGALSPSFQLGGNPRRRKKKTLLTKTLVIGGGSPPGGGPCS